MIRLGIDTGGTYTDAVVVDTKSKQVLAKAKALTTKDNLAHGISEAVGRLPRELLLDVQHAALSTTLATNACVENKGGRAKLIIVGTTDEVLHRVDARGVFGIPYEDVITTPFVGSYDGSEVTVPDWEALYAANPQFFEEADSFGIASLYALNNGAVVEQDGAEFLRERFGKFVIEASVVAAEPNVIGRGATALLNARLVPVIEEFLDAINEVFKQQGLDIPISIVRSDGSLMSEELARTRPVETILSGPAASVVGARMLVDAPESLIVDIGGTTSDVSIVHGGRPNRTEGIVIGGWKTQVSGVRIDTISLGGDTAARFTKNGRLELAQRRVTPLCVAAQRWPDEIYQALEYYLATSPVDTRSHYELVYLVRKPSDLSHYTDMERELLELLESCGPLSLYDRRMELLGMKTARLENEGYIMRCGMTPTDAMHLKGDFDAFDTEASRLGARCLLRSYRGKEAAYDDGEVAGLVDEIYDLARLRLYEQVIRAYAHDRYWPAGNPALDEQMQTLVRESWHCRRDTSDKPFSVGFSCTGTLIGVGAPTHVFVQEVADALGAPCATPQHAEVANAVGAAAARIAVELEVSVGPVRKSDGVIWGYQVAGVGESEHYRRREDAMVAAHDMVRRLALAEARRRGAKGDLECIVREEERMYKSLGAMKVVRDWVVRATVH